MVNFIFALRKSLVAARRATLSAGLSAGLFASLSYSAVVSAQEPSEAQREIGAAQDEIASAQDEAAQPRYAPEVRVEQIIVTAQQSFQSLRAQIDLAEVRLYSVYNELNEINEFDVDCRRSDWAGTHITEQICWPQFMTEMAARNVQDWRFGIDMLIPVEHLKLQSKPEFEALRANIRRVAGEHSDAADALLEVGVLQAAIQRKRETCMAQPAVLFVFRLCKS